MAHVLGLTIVAAILFFPLGVCLHWLALGDAARKQALPITVLSGLAVAVILFSAALQANIEVSSEWVRSGSLVLAFACIIAIYRWRPAWRTRDFGLALSALLMAFILLSWPVLSEQHGPLGNGTAHSPILQVSQIANVAEGEKLGGASVYERASSALDGHPQGFEQFAGFLVALSPDAWNPMEIHSLLLIFFAGLVTLPVFVLARWRGVGWLGTGVALILGVFSPIAFIAVGFAEGPGVAALPFSTCAILSIMIARRDRGWYALAALHAVAAWMLVGIAAMVPIAICGGIWLAIAGRSKERLKHTDLPVRIDRPVVFGSLALMFGLYGGLSQITSGHGIEWQPLTSEFYQAFMVWPYIWIGKSLQATVPDTTVGMLMYVMGPLLVILAGIFSVMRRDLRELAIIIGITTSVAFGVSLVLVTDSSTALIEYSWLAGAPLLAVVVVRGFGIIRGENKKGWRQVRGIGPLALLTTVGVLSIAATSTTGHRMSHTPNLPNVTDALNVAIGVAPSQDGSNSAVNRYKTAVLTPDSWLAYNFGATEINVPNIDQHVSASGAVQLPNHEHANFELLVLGTNPFESDPPSNYTTLQLRDEQGNLLPSPYRLFVSNDITAAAVAAGTAQATTSAKDAAKSSEPTNLDMQTESPVRHDPAEQKWVKKGGDYPEVGGLLAPPIEDLCISTESCVVGENEPTYGSSGDCTEKEIEEMSALTDTTEELYLADLKKEGTATTPESDPSNTGAQSIPALPGGDSKEESDSGDSGKTKKEKLDDAVKEADEEPPPNESTACWTIELDSKANTLAVRVKDIGLVLTPTLPSSDWERTSEHRHAVARTSEQRASIEFLRSGGLRQSYSYAATMEGRVASEGILSSQSGGPVLGSTSALALTPSQSWWSPTYPGLEVQGIPQFENTGGGETTVGRLVLRPSTGVNAHCNFVIPARNEGLYAFGPAFGTGIVALSVRPNEAAKTKQADKLGEVRLVMRNTQAVDDTPRTVMVDYVEQFTHENAKVDSCGTSHADFGARVEKELTEKKPANKVKLKGKLGAIVNQ